MAYTFQVGRKHFEYRRSIAFSNREELLSLLEAEAQEPVTRAQDGPRKIVFMFSGQGAQYAHMAADLYKDVPQFREEMDKGLALLRQLTGEDFKEVLFPSAGQEEKINETRYTQPLLFVLEYALARVVMSLGLVPSYMIGHSIGEYTAAALSGVLSFEDAVRLVAKRGELMNSLPTGSMLSVLMSEEEAKALATGNIYLAAVNAPGRVVFSGEKEAIDALHNQLKAQDISCIPLQTSHAFHSGMQDPILDEFRSEVAKTTFGKITTPFVSNLTGNFITEEQASSPDYWTSHLRNTVQFSAGIQALLAEEGSLQFIEVGPGQSLSGLLKQQPGQQAQTPVNLVRSEKKTAHDLRHFTEALGQLWTLGTSIDWNIYHKDEKRRRISLPTYSFEPTKYITEVSLEGSGLSPDISLINLTSQENNEGSEQETGPAPSNDPEDESLTPTERKVKALFRSFFGVETLSLSDNFFTLGGDSLKATRLASQVHREFGVQLSLNIFFENPTIGELARIIGQSLKTAYVGIEKAPDREFYPLSSAQNRLFFLQEFAPQSTGYNMPMVSYMGKEADPRRIDAVLHQLIARHESLRTSFVKIDGAAVQKIHEEVSFQLDTHECLPQEFENYFRSYIRPFDLAQAPLLRSSLVHIKEAGYAWIVDLHHIISDGTSQQVLAEDFMRLYRGEELPELRLQYRDFSEWQNNMQQSGELQKQKEYWLSRFSDGIPRLDLPADRVRPALFTFEGSMHSFTIHPELTTAVRAFYSNNHSTLQMTLLSVLNVLLYKYTGQDDLVIGHGIAGRRHADLEGIVGMFVNTLAIRTFPEGEKSFHNFHKEVAAACLAAYDNQDIQFEDLVKMLQVERDPSRNPVFDIALLVQNFKRSDESLSGIINPGAFAPELTQTTSHVTSKFDMTWFVEERGEDLLVNLEYYSAIYDRSTIERLSAHFVNILAAVMENPELLIEEIPLVDTASEKDLLEAYGYASGSGVHGAR
jgi:malonyl CoA-acyl carrier protein transacylase/acyl carrier protein